MVMSREDVFRASGPTSATSIDVKIGAKKDGTITAATAELRYTNGPFKSFWAMLGAMTSFACYDLKNVHTVGYDVVVNRPKVAAYRAPSAPMAAFAVESTMDLVAKAIDMDPLAFEFRTPRRKVHSLRMDLSMALLGSDLLWMPKEHPHMSAPLGPNQGRGWLAAFGLTAKPARA